MVGGAELRLSTRLIFVDFLTMGLCCDDLNGKE